MAKGQSAEKAIKDIRRRTRRRFSAEEKIRIVIEGMRGEDSISELCRREGITQSLYYKWSKEFLEAGMTAKEILNDGLIAGMDIVGGRMEKGEMFIPEVLKSANIMSTDDKQIKIMDFGLAKFRGSPQLTQMGTTVGTAAYMSPEQITGDSEALFRPWFQRPLL